MRLAGCGQPGGWGQLPDQEAAAVAELEADEDDAEPCLDFDSELDPDDVDPDSDPGLDLPFESGSDLPFEPDSDLSFELDSDFPFEPDSASTGLERLSLR